MSFDFSAYSDGKWLAQIRNHNFVESDAYHLGKKSRATNFNAQTHISPTFSSIVFLIDISSQGY